MAFNEVKECCKGDDGLAEPLHGEGLSYIGKRHATRLMSVAYVKGIVRGQAENTNLRANGKFNDVTAAACFKTCGTATFFAFTMVLTMVFSINIMCIADISVGLCKSSTT